MNELKVSETNTQIAEVFNYKEKCMEYLEAMGNKLPAKHKAQFLEMAEAFQLNPFKREIYAVGYGENWNIITGYEVYLKRAERIGKLDGWNATVEGSGETMTSTVTIFRKDWTHPFTHTVLFSEVCQKTKDGKLNSIWAKMPSFMCRKVAIAQAFRLCFPDEFGGMPYTSDEMPAAEDLKDVTPKTNDNLAEQATKSAKTPAKKYTKAQAEELGKYMNATLDNGEAVFNDDEKNSARQMLFDGYGKEAIENAKEVYNKRINATVVEPTQKDIEQELEA